MYSYGATMYMPDLGRWGVIDNKAEKYSSLFPDNYVANNPLMFVNPDGNDIVFSQTKRDDGTTVVTMTVTGKLINESSKQYTQEQMNSYVDRLSVSLQDVYGKKEINLK